ncbi:hypothetical protein EB001_10720 [bacterium]|nr:hypothetical protein [bacterium]
MTQFVDGAPLDASILAELENKINIVSSKTPSIGDNLSNSTPQMLAGIVKPGKFTSGGKVKGQPDKVIIQFTKGHFSKVPTVVATIVSPQGGLVDDNINIAIGDVTTETATIWVYFQTTNKTTQKVINISWIALAY